MSDGHEAINLVPAETGLPMTVWVSPRGRTGRARGYDVRLRVHKTHGVHIVVDNTAVVGVRPVPHLVENWLRPKDQVLVYQWAALNEAALVDYWEERINSREFLDRLQRLP